MKKTQRLVGLFFGDEILPSYIGHYFINHELRILSLTNQDDSMERIGGFFSWLHIGGYVCVKNLHLVGIQARFFGVFFHGDILM